MVLYILNIYKKKNIKMDINSLDCSWIVYNVYIYTSNHGVYILNIYKKEKNKEKKGT